MNPSRIEFEVDLENWITSDPGLLQKGLTLVGRQVHTDVGKIDLLGIDRNGDWVVIELKRDLVGQKVMAQALAYIPCIEQIPFEELSKSHEAFVAEHEPDREESLKDLLEKSDPDWRDDGDRRRVKMIVAGVRRDASLGPIDGSLMAKDLGLKVVTFDIFESSSGVKFLARRESESERTDRTAQKKTGPWKTKEEIVEVARTAGNGELIENLIQQSEKVLGVAVKPRIKAIMFAPQRNQGSCLYVINVKTAMLYVSASGIAKFYDVDEKNVSSGFQEAGFEWGDYLEFKLTNENAEICIQTLKKFIAEKG